MERVIFRIEDTGQSVSCLLNPESLEIRRASGIARQSAAGGIAAGAEPADDPVLFTGGGHTELTLQLLFDVTLGASDPDILDVRRLTGPLWQLAENARRGDGDWRPAQVHLFWGKERAIHGVITDIAERLDYFSASGVPQRSWLSMRLLRLADAPGGPPTQVQPLPDVEPHNGLGPSPETDLAGSASLVHEVQSDGDRGGDRLDQLAWRYYGNASAWRTLAWLNDVTQPLQLAAGTALRVATGGRTGSSQ